MHHSAAQYQRERDEQQS
jgi:hypothetical protein